MSDFYNNSIFWVEVDRISPNPYQPRKEFNDEKIAELADSIRQYGVLQPLVVTRKEIEREDGGIAVEYELIAGERRLRAAKMAMLPQVPVIIRAREETDKMKLELAIIENLQREDLNAIDRALAFKQLVDEFNLKHIEVAKKVGKSREYVSNTLRLLALPKEIQDALVAGEITEGHARPLLMLSERPQERDTLFEEIKARKLTVRESERIARRIATDKARKQDLPPELVNIEKSLTKTLGTRVQIEQRSKEGGKVHIDYFSEEDLRRLLDILAQEKIQSPKDVVSQHNSQVSAEAINTFNNTFSASQISANSGSQSFIQSAGQSSENESHVHENTDKDLDNVNYKNNSVMRPFKEFELSKEQPSIKASEQIAAYDPFADLPPLPPLPSIPDVGSDENPADTSELKDAKRTTSPFNPFMQNTTMQTQTEPEIPKNPFAVYTDVSQSDSDALYSPTLHVNNSSTSQDMPDKDKRQSDDDLYSIKNFSV